MHNFELYLLNFSGKWTI